jgi:hypothetical protein
VLDAAGFSCISEGPGVGVRLYQCETLGTVRFFPRHQVLVLSASGQACAQLRSCGLWGEYLASISAVCHRVTTLHATLEIDADAPPVLAEVLSRAHQGAISISRKAVPPSHVQQIFSPGLDGRVTGTVYLGGPNADVRAVVYDKREERWRKTERDVGPLLRYEMRLKSGCRVTLRDAFAPVEVFYHYASPALVARPEGVPDWSPKAEGYMLPKRQEFTPWQLIDRKLEFSPDVRRLVELARECGPHGVDLLCSRIKRMVESRDGALGSRSDREAVPAETPGVH